MTVPSDALELFQQMAATGVSPAITAHQSKLIVSMATINFAWDTSSPRDFVEVFHNHNPIMDGTQVIGIMHRSHLMEDAPAILKVLAATCPSEYRVRCATPSSYTNLSGKEEVSTQIGKALKNPADAPQIRFKQLSWEVSMGQGDEHMVWLLTHYHDKQRVCVECPTLRRKSPLKSYMFFSSTEAGGQGLSGISQTLHAKGAGWEWYNKLKEWANDQDIPHYHNAITLQAIWQPDGDVKLKAVAGYNGHFGIFYPKEGKGVRGGFVNLTTSTGILAPGTKHHGQAQQWSQWVLKGEGRDVLMGIPLEGHPIVDARHNVGVIHVQEQESPIVELDLV